MVYPLLIRLQHGIPRSLTSPDAWLAIIVAAILQYRQFRRLEYRGNDSFHIIPGAKSKHVKFNGVWSWGHQRLLTNLRMFVSPLPNEASELSAGMVDLRSDKDLAHLAKEAASGRLPNKKSSRSSSVGKITHEKMEVRSRRILKGELVHNQYYPLLETTANLSLAVMVGLASRWLFGLLRALQLSSVSSETNSLSGSEGPCCSPYTGGEDDGTRLAGSFERLLACVLVKKEGDDAGNFLLTMSLLIFLLFVVKLAWSVSSSSSPNPADNDGGKVIENKGDAPMYTRIHPNKIRRALVGAGAALSSIWFFHTPVLLRLLGMDGLREASEELSARILLFGNLLGIVSLPRTELLGLSDGENILTNAVLAFLGITWGYIASSLIAPIEEMARNAAHILSPSKKRLNPSEMMDLINVRIMLIIQAVAPFMIMCTYFLNNHFADSMKNSVRGGQMRMTFSKQYLQNSGLFVRVALSWCFISACAYCFRSLLQSYLDQATAVASAMDILGEGNEKDGISERRGTLQTSFRKADPFNDRYKNVVLTAGRIVSFPALTFGMLALVHLRGGDGTAHPGIGYQSQPKHAPRSILAVNKLLPSYSNRYMTWIFKQEKSVGAGDGLIHAAALSLPWQDESPFRDFTHKTIVGWLGKNWFCPPPSVRSVKSLSRHVKFLLDDNNGESTLTMTALTGRELLELAPPVPVTFVDIILGRKPEKKSCASEADPNDNRNRGVCDVSIETALPLKHPSLSEMLSFIVSHEFFTPTVVSPIMDTMAFLCSLWWNYWYSFRLVVYYIKLRKLSLNDYS